MEGHRFSTLPTTPILLGLVGRVVSLWLTYIAISAGWASEGNPFARYLLVSYGWLGLSTLAVASFVVACLLIVFEGEDWMFWIVAIVNLADMCWNLTYLTIMFAL